MRPIILSNELGIIFKEPNSKNIFNYSFLYILSNIIQYLCYKCKLIHVENLKLKCGFQYYKSCLLEEINELTNNYIILNRYEKIIRKSKVYCKNFDLNERLKLIKIEDIYIRKAIDRIMILLIISVLFVKKKLNKNIPTNKQNNKYHEISIFIYLFPFLKLKMKI